MILDGSLERFKKIWVKWGMTVTVRYVLVQKKFKRLGLISYTT